MTAEAARPLVALVVAAESDWGILQHASIRLAELGIAHTRHVVAAQDAPQALQGFVDHAEERGVRVFVAASAGHAPLAAGLAAHTLRPVLGVPLESPLLRGLDALVATVQTTPGTAVGGLAVGRAGAVNAALLAAAILALDRPDLAHRLGTGRAQQAASVLAASLA